MSAPKEPADAIRPVAEAAAWRVRLSEADAESSEAFETWLAADSLNAAAWQRVGAAWDQFDDNPAAPELITLRHAALREAERFGRSRWRSDGKTIKYAAAAIIALCAAAWGAIAWIERPIDYTTEMGERRIITLSDGSQVTLDSASELKVRYTEHARRLELLRGQARFEVAHDLMRPFTVQAGTRTVVATGTDFDVDLSQSQLLVTLIRGHVEVTGGTHAVDLNPGEQFVQTPAAASKRGHVAIGRILAWENGQLIFDNEPLASVVARVSRYSSVSVSIADEKVAATRISGVFRTGDIAGFVDTVTRYLPVEAIQGETGEIRLYEKK